MQKNKKKNKNESSLLENIEASSSVSLVRNECDKDRTIGRVCGCEQDSRSSRQTRFKTKKKRSGLAVSLASLKNVRSLEGNQYYYSTQCFAGLEQGPRRGWSERGGLLTSRARENDGVSILKKTERVFRGKKNV